MSVHNSSSQILTAFFDGRSEAESAIDRIVGEGIRREAITIVEGADPSGERHHKSFFEKLGDLFIPSEDRQTYAEGLRRGGYFVSVPTSAANHERVRDILDEEGTVDMAEREAGWRQQGWVGTEAEYDAPRISDPLERPSAERSQRLDRSALFDRAPSPGPSGTGRAGEMGEASRFGRRDESRADTRTRSYVFDDFVAQDHLQRSEEEALGYGPSTRDEPTPGRTAVEIEDERLTEAERLRSGERDR
jgi:hypothetical protein